MCSKFTSALILNFFPKNISFSISRFYIIKLLNYEITILKIKIHYIKVLTETNFTKLQMGGYSTPFYSAK